MPCVAKIITLSQLPTIIREARCKKQRLVLATGVFDLLHSGHLKFLQAAQKHGDILLVGLETDKRVKKLKGSERPIWNLSKRLEMVSKVEGVDYIFALPEKFATLKDYEQFMSQVKPDILAVSSHTPYQSIKKILVEKYGGRLKVVLAYHPHVSTSKIWQKMKRKMIIQKETS